MVLQTDIQIKKICKQNKVNNGRLLAKMKAPVAEVCVCVV